MKTGNAGFFAGIKAEGKSFICGIGDHDGVIVDKIVIPTTTPVTFDAGYTEQQPNMAEPQPTVPMMAMSVAEPVYEEPAFAPMAAAAPVYQEPAFAPTALPQVEEISCPSCSTYFEIPLEPRPMSVQCPSCGMKGVID